MTRITDKMWNSVITTLKVGARNGIINPEFLENRPTHILDIYKMRRGRYKNVRIWTRLDLGNGHREDLFITTADNQPINGVMDLFNSSSEIEIQWKENEND